MNSSLGILLFLQDNCVKLTTTNIVVSYRAYNVKHSLGIQYQQGDFSVDIVPHDPIDYV
jgi:hypothetical protein